MAEENARTIDNTKDNPTKEKLYNLTTPQKNIWSVDQYYNNTSINTISGTVFFHEEIDVYKMQTAVNILVRLYDAFSLQFKNENDEIKQYFDKDIARNFYAKIYKLNDETDLAKLEREASHQVFSKSKLFDIKVFQLANKHGGFIFSTHHLLGDSWALGLVYNTVVNVYYDIINNPHLLPKYNKENFSELDDFIQLEKDVLRVGTYTDFISKENEYLESSSFEKDKTFWNDIFSTVPDLPKIAGFDRTNQDTSSCAGVRKEFKIPKDIMEKVQEFCKENKTSVFNFLMSIYSIYISNISGLDDFVIGTPVLNRSTFAEKHTIGMYVSTMPLRINVNPDTSFMDFAKKISNDTFSCFRHQHYPYECLLNDLREKNGSVPNLYNTILSYQIIKNITDKFDCESYWTFNGNSGDDLQMHIIDYNDTGALSVLYDYKKSAYTFEDIKYIHARIEHMINQVLENKNAPIRSIEVVTPEEKSQILNEFNDTYADYPRDKTVAELFEEQVEKTPNNVAVVFENQKLTYKELNEKANSLAKYLRSNGVTDKDTVTILLNRSLELIISIYAVIKSGARYTLIDTALPRERIHYIIQNSGAKYCITNSSNYTEDKVPLIDVNTFDFNKNSKITNLPIKKSNNDLCIIYTSGSTGNPKGVILHNRGFINLIYTFDKEMNISKYKNILGIATVSFDMFAVELFSSTLFGNTLVLANEEEQKNPIAMSNLIKNNNVEFLITTPTRIELLLSDEYNNSLSNLKGFQLGGEKFTKNLYNKLRKATGAKIFNGYGPTEITACCSNKLVSTDDITIGTPLSNMQMYICNSNTNLLPIGVVGEICVAGDGISHGYLNNKNATDKAFIKNPFGDGYLYKTGDLGKYRKSGEIDYVGRSDFQVKIRGLRIELEEIENQILKLPLITSCAVAKKVDDQNHEFLCAYFTTNNEIDTGLIRSHLEKYLPRYMVPQYYIKLDKLPHTFNGKIDKNSLPEPTSYISTHETIPPRNEIDIKLLTLFKELLKTDNISIEDSFFDIGGDSLSAINLYTKLQKEFNTKLSIKDIMEHPVLSDLSDIILTNKNTSKSKTIERIPKANFYDVSSAQKRIYFASQASGTSVAYNVPGGVILDGRIDEKKIEKCFNQIIKRHESLRTYFTLNGDNVVQKIADDIDFKLDVIDNANFEDLNSLFADFVKPFDLSKAPLFRIKFIKFENGKSALFTDLHHIICDGASSTILVDELCKLYNGEKLPELEITYKDFAYYENKRLSSGALKDAEEYWLNKFEGEIPVLDMPTQYPRPAVQSFEGAKVHSVIGGDTKEKIEMLAHSLNVTPYMILLACYYILLSKYTSQNDIIVGSPVVGRDIESTYDLLGVFVNTLALHEKINNKSSFRKFVLSLKDDLLDSYQYQTYPFDELVNKLNITRDTSRNPLFDIMFIYQNNGYKNMYFHGIKSEYYIPDTNISKFDLSVEAIPNNDCINLSFEYCTKIFSKDFIKKLSTHYLNIIYSVLSNTDIKISDIQMLTSEEKNQILNEFNDTYADYPRDKTVAELFEEQVEKTPNNVAVVFENQKLTYKELNEKANSLARYLRSNGVTDKDTVTILLNRSLELIISIYAVIKSGARYTLIDATLPQDRINYIIQNSSSKYCIVNSEYDIENKASLIDLNIFDFNKYNSKTIKPSVKKTSDDLCIIYTSGSTGRPKGVMLQEQGFINLVYAFDKEMNISKYKNILGIATVSFDMFAVELFSSTLFGNTLVLANEEEQKNPVAMSNLIRNNGVEFLITTPSRIELLLLDECNNPLKNVKAFQLGGEKLTISLCNKLRKATNAEIFNGYGPTEITACCSNKLISNNISIGKPLQNTQIYICDSNTNLVPVGVIGEICVAGLGVSNGYLNNPSATEKSFIKNPFGDGKIYKTGDLGKYKNNGEIEYIGRSDFQFKLRGLRIEPGEIEKQIESYRGISNAVVVVKNIGERKILCGYFIADSNISISLLRNKLSKNLPNYMVPSYLVQLSNFEHTSNGKIDRNKLPTPKIIKKDVLPPKTDLQKKLLLTWKDILSIDDISIDDNFFDIGGDSICAIKLQLELMKINININYGDIFKNPTIESLANFVENIKSNDDIPIYHKRDFRKINKLLKKNTVKHKLKLHQREIKDVLLTGSTGYLGIHVLAELLKIDNIKIYCLVREDPGTSTKNKLKNKFKYYFGSDLSSLFDKRIFVIPGEITEENFGLSYEKYRQLAHSVYHVINCAANVKHYGNYDDFEKVNVAGVKNLVEFCEGYGKDFTQISTLSISGKSIVNASANYNPKKKIYFGEDSLFINQSLDNVYIRSKFEAEKFILDEIAHKKLKGIILRVGNITNRYSDGKFQENSDDNAFLNRLKAFLYLKTIPQSMADGYLEFSPVDSVAESIINCMEFYTTETPILHLYNSKHLLVNDLIIILNDLGINMQVVDDEIFKINLKKVLFNSSNFDKVKVLINDVDKDYNLMYQSNINIINTLTLKYLDLSGFDWPEITKEYIKKIINNL